MEECGKVKQAEAQLKWIVIAVPLVRGSHSLMCLSELPEARRRHKGEQETQLNTLVPVYGKDKKTISVKSVSSLRGQSQGSLSPTYLSTAVKSFHFNCTFSPVWFSTVLPQCPINGLCGPTMHCRFPRCHTTGWTILPRCVQITSSEESGPMWEHENLTFQLTRQL